MIAAAVGIVAVPRHAIIDGELRRQLPFILQIGAEDVLRGGVVVHDVESNVAAFGTGLRAWRNAGAGKTLEAVSLDASSCWKEKAAAQRSLRYPSRGKPDCATGKPLT